ncbi:MAG TPA: translation initiation factor IF-2 [bacterium]|nr:translation initiation factor IF-2 [bacterium]
MRIYEIAKKLGVHSKKVIEILETLEIKNKTHLSALSEEEYKKFKEYLSREEKITKPTTVEEKVKKVIKVSENETVGEISKKFNLSPSKVIKDLMEMGIIANINQSISLDTIKKLCDKEGYICEVIKGEEEKEKEKEKKISKNLIPRGPVVTVMGHVDHGKTTILDSIRKTKVVEQEAGQITQKIGAYKIVVNNHPIVFIDTPGHEAFTAMRALGAKVTDIVVLVVAADEGIKPQTIEALNHAKSANVPIIVAINKIDKPNANIDRVKQQFSEIGVIPDDWGGDTIFVPVSGYTGQGINDLLEMIILVGEMLELKADPTGKGEGTVIESKLDQKMGPLISIIVENGTLNISDSFVVGNTWGKVKAMFDDKGNRLTKAGPTTPVEILGSHNTVKPGEKFLVVDSEKEGRRIAEEKNKKTIIQPVKKITLEDLYKEIEKGIIKELKIILKCDTSGSIDAIKEAISKVPQNEVEINILHSGTGQISESDVLLADASNGIVIGFNVAIEPKAKDLAKKEHVEVKTYNIIYDLIDDLSKSIEGMLIPETKETLTGQAIVKKVFKVGKNLAVAGCLVVDGKVIINSKAKVVRDGQIIYEGSLVSLKRFKESVREVPKNTECGIIVSDFTNFKEGDIIQSYIEEEVPKNLTKERK